MNATLKKIIESKSNNEINNALSAVEEYLATGTKVKSKAGLLRKALEENWIPNLTLKPWKPKPAILHVIPSSIQCPQCLL